MTVFQELSAGAIPYRWVGDEVLHYLVLHSATVRNPRARWEFPKGGIEPGETPRQAAAREFHEETGFAAHGPFHELGAIRQAGGKQVTAWAFAGDCNPATLTSNLCEIEWPPRSGRTLEVPEVDRGAWFSLPEARQRILRSQIPLLDRLEAIVKETLLRSPPQA